MKILLTGLPKSGKSTMLANIISEINPRRGLFSPEVRENGERIGFDLRDERGETAILSRVGAPTNYPVGRYYVDLTSLEQFIEHLFEHTSDQLLCIDEVGQMQLYSERFKSLVKDYLEAPNDFIGTVSAVYDHPFIHDLRQCTDILVCTVTPENRTELGAALAEALDHRSTFHLLPNAAQHKAMDLARGYLAKGQYVSLKKLFGNAVPYVAGGKVYEQGDEFVVQGNTNDHQVRSSHGNFVCDCDLFNGRGQFAGKAGECSHIQSARLVLATSLTE